MSKIIAPVFIDEIQRDAYRFIMEEEGIKTDYKIGKKTYKEVEWEYDKPKNRILVYLDVKNGSQLIIPFFLERFPGLARFLEGISGVMRSDI